MIVGREFQFLDRCDARAFRAAMQPLLQLLDRGGRAANGDLDGTVR
jgi:hypothetical protein